MINYQASKLLLLLIILVGSCKNERNQTNNYSKTEKEFDILELVIESSKFGIKQLGIDEIEKEKTDKLRIWRFPEGGVVFEEMYEMDITTRTLEMNSYLIENLTMTDREENLDLNFSRKIESLQISDELASLIDNSNFHLSIGYDKYCDYIPYLSDYYLIEIRHYNKINRFGLGEEIKDCEKEEVEKMKKLYEVITKLVRENSTW